MMSDSRATGSCSKDEKNDPDANLTGYEKMCRGFNGTPNPEMLKVARKFEEEEKNQLKKVAKNIKNRQSAAGYEKLCRAFGAEPNHVVMKAARELDAEEKEAKTK